MLELLRTAGTESVGVKALARPASEYDACLALLSAAGTLCDAQRVSVVAAARSARSATSFGVVVGPEANKAVFEVGEDNDDARRRCFVSACLRFSAS